MASQAPTRLFRWVERCLWGIALLCFGGVLFVHVSAHAAQRSADEIVAASTPNGPSANIPAPRADTSTSRSASVIGRLEIPQIALRVAILSDYQPDSLLRGVGHIHGTANPGGLGNLVLAGHRDTYFKPLRRIVKGMDVRVVNQDGVYHYQVDTTELVKPEQVDILNIGDRPELTLITCYPFDYIGPAPERFIVHAHLISAMPAAR